MGCVDLAAEVLRDGEGRSSDRTSLVCAAAADGRARSGSAAGGGPRRRRSPRHRHDRTPASYAGRRRGMRICAACVELCQEIAAGELSEV
jgi:hypothetical protein